MKKKMTVTFVIAGVVVLAAAVGVAQVANVTGSVEQLGYKVVKEYDDFEVRQYDAHIIAEVEMEASWEQAGNRAFRILGGYIFGNNKPNDKIAMTAPVNQEPAPQKGEKIAMTAPVNQEPAPASNGNSEGEGEKIAMTAPVNQESATGTNKHLVSFVMPAEYTMESLPEPTDPRVTLKEVPSKLMASVRYTGSWSREKYEIFEKKLFEGLEREGFERVSKPIFARYNDPFTPSFLRRNEIVVEVKAPEGFEPDPPADEEKDASNSEAE